MAVRITRAGVALTVGIIVVTGLIIAGLFWIRGAGEQARQDEATKIAQQQLEAESRNDVALNEGDEENTSETESQTETSTENSATNNSTEESTSSQAGNSGSSATTPATELPQTGASDVGPVLVLALLTFSVVSYVASKRQLLQH